MSYTFTDWKSGTKPPKGWDAADACRDGWTLEDVEQFMRGTVQPWSSPSSIERTTKPNADDKSADRAVVGKEPAERSSPPAGSAIPQARTTEQAQPATVTQLHTRKTVQADDTWTFDLVCNEEGKVKPGITKNWALYLENHPDMQGVLAFDAFKRCVMLMRAPPWERGDEWEPRVLRDADFSEAVMWLETKFMTPKVSNISAVIQTVAEHNSFDALDEYLRELEWDGKARVENFMSSYMGAVDNAYHRTVAKRWLISAVARALNPGCKVDTMPVFEGTQGAFKSTALRRLFGDEFFTDELSDIGSKDAMMEMQGVWCIEVAEMHRFNASDANQVKKFLTRQVDRYRPPYGRSVVEAPRRCLLGGTMNPEGNPYFKDSTGARRFWPVVVGRVNLDKIAADRDQIWAEAVRMFLDGVPWWVQSDEVEDVLSEQEKRIDVDVWTSLISTAIKSRISITQWELFGIVGLQSKEVDTRHAQRIGRVMKQLGWTGVRRRENGEDTMIFEGPSLLDGANSEPEKMDW